MVKSKNVSKLAQPLLCDPHGLAHIVVELAYFGVKSFIPSSHMLKMLMSSPTSRTRPGTHAIRLPVVSNFI